jgi:hypothetical protein
MANNPFEVLTEEMRRAEDALEKMGIAHHEMAKKYTEAMLKASGEPSAYAEKGSVAFHSLMFVAHARELSRHAVAMGMKQPPYGGSQDWENWLMQLCNSAREASYRR